MRLDRVTITGADDSIGHPANLIPLTKEFPFVEWGILASRSQNGDGVRGNTIFFPRYPSFRWIAQLKELSDSNKMNLSLHLCGKWVRDLLVGEISVPSSLLDGPAFQRVQLNFHAEKTACNPPQFHAALNSIGSKRRPTMESATQWIFQIDGANGNVHLESLYGENDLDRGDVDAVPLFDISGGAGILPTEWPKPEYMENDVDNIYHGYAGGLGPETLQQQFPLIADAAGETRIWIDMETSVRSDGDRLFDLDKVRRCLEICAPFVT
jgi:hypothetical protein